MTFREIAERLERIEQLAGRRTVYDRDDWDALTTAIERLRLDIERHELAAKS